MRRKRVTDRPTRTARARAMRLSAWSSSGLRRSMKNPAPPRAASTSTRNATITIFMKNDYSTAPSIPPAGSPAPGDVPEGAAPRPPNLRSRLGWFVVALLAASLTARFGVWQLSRAHQKEATAAMIAERSGQPALAAAELARDAATGEGQWQRHIVLQG